AHLGERCAQLVRHAGDEVGSEPRQLALTSEVHYVNGREPDAQREDAQQEWKTLARELSDEQRLRECRPKRDDALETAEVVELVGAGVRIRVLYVRLQAE